jgi:hypothetical protein
MWMGVWATRRSRWLRSQLLLLHAEIVSNPSIAKSTASAIHKPHHMHRYSVLCPDVILSQIQ